MGRATTFFHVAWISKTYLSLGRDVAGRGVGLAAKSTARSTTTPKPGSGLSPRKITTTHDAVRWSPDLPQRRIAVEGTPHTAPVGGHKKLPYTGVCAANGHVFLLNINGPPSAVVRRGSTMRSRLRSRVAAGGAAAGMPP